MAIQVLIQQQLYYERATELIKESLDLARQSNDERSIILYQEHLGLVAAQQGKYVEAVRWVEESLKLAQTLGYKSSIAACLSRLGRIESRQQNYTQATKRFGESLYLYRELENNQEMVRLLWQFINLAINQGYLEQAARLTGGIDRLTKKLNLTWYADEATSYDEMIARVRTSLDEETFTTLWAAGQTLTLDQVIAEVST